MEDIHQRCTEGFASLRVRRRRRLGNKRATADQFRYPAPRTTLSPLLLVAVLCQYSVAFCIRPPPPQPLLLQHQQYLAAFVSPSTRIRRGGGGGAFDPRSSLSLSKDVDVETTPSAEQRYTASSTRHQVCRRSALATLASVAALPQLAAFAASPTQGDQHPLERIALGDGQWVSGSTKKSRHGTSSSSFIEYNANTAQYTAAFCTYAARILINYDSGVRTWWTALEESTLQSSSPNDDSSTAIVRQLQFSRSFGSFAKSLQDTFQQESIPPDQLYDVLVSHYTSRQHDAEAARHIALLFALLPPEQQPVAKLEQYYASASASASSTTMHALPNDSSSTTQPPLSNVGLDARDLSRLARGSAGSSSTDQWTQLLSRQYRLVRLPNGNSFTIDPKLNNYSPVPSLPGLDVATPFGYMSSLPLTREIPTYSPSTYALFGLAGASGCALTHALVIPLDVLKTRAQTDPIERDGTLVTSRPSSLLDSGRRIVETEGFGALLLGTQATIVGYFWYGFSVYPCYTFFKRFLTQSFYPLDVVAAAQRGNEIALIAGACAAVVASLGLSPIEAARIRAVANPTVYKPLGLVGTLTVIATEDVALGWKNLYAGLPSLLTRQVLFGSIKFLAFERACEFLYTVWPFLLNAKWTMLAVSLVAGGWSGVVSSVFSQPADSVLTYVSKEGTVKSNNGSSSSDAKLNVLDGVRQMVTTDGPASLFRGLGSRCVWAGCIIAGQFLLYDVFRTFFGVSAEDLSQVFYVNLSR